MRARLVTTCGCSREISVPYPPQFTIVVPLNTMFSVWFDEDNPPQFTALTTRTFDLRFDGGPNGVSEYRERMR